MRLRKATVDDAQQLAALLKDIGWFDTFKDESVAHSTRQVGDQLERCLTDGSHFVCVAQSDNDEIIGYISVHWLPYLFMPGPEGYVSELFVHAALRGQGVGRQLLQAAETEARARGCSRLSLMNLRSRESYQRQFYIKAGWTERREAANFIYPLG